MKCGGRRSWQGDNDHAMCHRRFWLFPNKQTETTASQTKIIQTLFLIVLEHWLMDKLLKSMMMMMFITIFAGD